MSEDQNQEERTVGEAEGNEASENAPAVDEQVKVLAEALELKTKEAAEAQEKYLRAYADFDNSRKRMQRELADFRTYANEQLAHELLPVVDHLGLALMHAADGGQDAGAEADSAIRKGVEMVYKQLRDVLEKFGIKQFSSVGEAFDPARHDAMMQVPSSELAPGMVVQVFQEGYMYREKVLRHARVSVSTKA